MLDILITARFITSGRVRATLSHLHCNATDQHSWHTSSSFGIYTQGLRRMSATLISGCQIPGVQSGHSIRPQRMHGRSEQKFSSHSEHSHFFWVEKFIIANMCVLQFQWARKTVKRAQLKQDLSQKIYKAQCVISFKSGIANSHKLMKNYAGV